MVSISNIYLQEAIEPSEVKPTEVVALIKKTMNTCKLTKFKSQGECAKLYSYFFLNTLDSDVTISVNDWGIIYTTLFSDATFLDNLCLYIAMYRPKVYNNIFHVLFNQVKSEYQEAGKRKVAYLASAKAIFMMLQLRFESIRTIVTSQVHDPDALKFLVVIDQTLQQMIFELKNMVQNELTSDVDPDEIQPIIDVEASKPLAEDVQEIIDLLEHADEWIAEHTPMNEGIVNNAVQKAKEVKLNAQKATKAFDDFVMKKFRDMTLKRRNAKHSEMVGESLRITREIKRLLKSGALAILSPTIGILHWIITLFIDKKTDVKDRKVLTDEIQDELEIVEEKISMAERNGDDKAKIELIRFRQKLQREYERITKIRYDKVRADQRRNRGMK